MKLQSALPYLILALVWPLTAQINPGQDQSSFAEHPRRCGTLNGFDRAALYPSWERFVGTTTDCSSNNTNPSSDYDPTTLYEIPVVFHVLMTNDCNTGVVTDTQIMEQMDILNEDFLALAGTLGAPGNDTQIRFVLATLDPDGNPTTGITRSCNSTWFNDSGGYFNSLAWDTNRYMNIYTNTASGNLGYVPWLPSDNDGGNVGIPADRVVMDYTTIGRNAPTGPPYHLGRTTTHEVGHYLGLEHTFASQTCSQGPCFTSGDLICDTNPENSPNGSACSDSQTACGLTRPIHNYMNYSDDDCMYEFTPQQLRRMRCALETYRSSLFREIVLTCDLLAVSLPETDLTCDGGLAQLFASISGDSGDYTVSWTPSDTLDDASVINPIASPTVTTTYTVQIDDALGCTDTASVTVFLGPSNGDAFLASWRDSETYDPEFDIDGDFRISVVDLTWYANGCLPAPLRVGQN